MNTGAARLLSACLICACGGPPADVAKADFQLATKPVGIDTVHIAARGTHDTTVIMRPSGIAIDDGTGATLTAVSVVDRLSNGDFVVLDRTNRILSLFDPVGRAKGDFGAVGDGPGEFRSARSAVVLKGDTVALLAENPQRVIYYTGDRSYVRQSSTSFEWPQLLLPTGDLLLVISGGRPAPLGYSRPISIFALAHPRTTGSVDTIGWFRSSVAHVTQDRAVSVEYSPSTYVAAGERWVYIGDSGEYSVGQFDYDGRLRRIIQREPTKVRVSKADQAMLMREYREIVSRIRDPSMKQLAARNATSDMEFMKVRPNYERLLVDDSNNLWVLEGRYPDGRQEWAMFSETGTHVADIVFRLGREWIMKIGADYVITRNVDDNGVAGVKLYRLSRPARATTSEASTYQDG